MVEHRWRKRSRFVQNFWSQEIRFWSQNFHENMKMQQVETNENEEKLFPFVSWFAFESFVFTCELEVFKRFSAVATKVNASKLMQHDCLSFELSNYAWTWTFWGVSECFIQYSDSFRGFNNTRTRGLTDVEILYFIEIKNKRYFAFNCVIIYVIISMLKLFEKICFLRDFSLVGEMRQARNDGKLR